MSLSVCRAIAGELHIHQNSFTCNVASKFMAIATLSFNCNMHHQTYTVMAVAYACEVTP